MAKSKDNFIPRPLQPEAEAPWTRDLHDALRCVEELAAFLNLSLPAVRTPFPFLVTRHYAAKINPENPADPLLRQILPDATENQSEPGFISDPVGDRAAIRAPGILQKYAGRALVIPTAACAIHCRYCFRRAFPYDEQETLKIADRLSVWLKGHPDIREIILSGGDPLLISNERLAEIFSILERFGQIQRVRLHTRLPVVLPSRFESGLLKVLSETPFSVVLVSHVNHPDELDDASAEVFAHLRTARVHLLNQSVLLRGVNDLENTLITLSEKLFAQGVLPYYLHQLDRVTGAQSFEVSRSVGKSLIAAMRRRLPGYLVPRYVQEVSGAPHKTPLW